MIRNGSSIWLPSPWLARPFPYFLNCKPLWRAKRLVFGKFVAQVEDVGGFNLSHNESRFNLVDVNEFDLALHVSCDESRKDSLVIEGRPNHVIAFPYATCTQEVSESFKHFLETDNEKDNQAEVRT